MKTVIAVVAAYFAASFIALTFWTVAMVAAADTTTDPKKDHTP
jgi:hypothetical protein